MTRRMKASVVVTAVLWLWAGCGVVWAVDGNDPNLVAHWKFDDGSGLVAEDSAGDNDGTLVDGPVWVDGQIDGALEFDGVNDCVDATDFSLGERFTVAMWVNPADIADGQCLIGKHESDGSNIFLVGLWRGGYHGRIRSDTYESGTKTTGWQHIVAVVEQVSPSSSEYTFYKDGEVLWSHTFSEVTGDMSGKGWTIGQDWDVGSGRGEFFHGAVDDVRIYDKALTSEEVEGLYEEGASGLVAHWKLDEGAGTAAEDSAGDNDGTLVDGPVWVEGLIGDYALEFDGVDDYVDCGSDSSLMLTNNLTLAFWYNSDTVDPTNYTGVVGTWLNSAPTQSSYGVNQKNTGQLQAIRPVGGSWNALNTTLSITDGNWYHIAVVYNSNGTYLYVDGSLDKSNSVGGDLNIASRVTMASTVAGTHNFNGVLDDVRIYARALSPEEIEALYEEGEVPDDLTIAVDNLQMVIGEKLRIMAELEGLVEAEWEAYDALLRILNSGEYGDLTRRDLLASMMIIDRAANREVLCASRLGILADRLTIALNRLGYDYVLNDPPAVMIVNPADGDTFYEFDPVVIEAQAVDSDGFVAKVEFFVDDVKISEDTDPLDGWTSEWAGGEGIYSLTAAATDNADGFMISEPVEINVVISPGK